MTCVKIIVAVGRKLRISIIRNFYFLKIITIGHPLYPSLGFEKKELITPLDPKTVSKTL